MDKRIELLLHINKRTDISTVPRVGYYCTARTATVQPDSTISNAPDVATTGVVRGKTGVLPNVFPALALAERTVSKPDLVPSIFT